MSPSDIDKYVELALQEDIGDGDHTTLATVPENDRGKSHLLVKEDGIIAGIGIAVAIFRKTDPAHKMELLLKDGMRVKKGDIAFVVEANTRALLSSERLVLNFMQRMSGIATETRRYVDRIERLKTKIVDTRKTTPNMRWFEKYAVRIGGGGNHRMGLYDMIMIKDNHVDFAGGITNAITAVKEYLTANKRKLNVEIEVRNMAELEEVMLVGGVDRIMLDNFNPADLKVAIERIGGIFETEASGGITIDTVRSYAETGVDYISVGALTHHISSLDLSLKALK